MIEELLSLDAGGPSGMNKSVVMAFPGNACRAEPQALAQPAPDRPATPADVISLGARRGPAPALGHDWIVDHLVQLVRYCERNGLDAEESALAEAIDRLIEKEGRGARRN